MARNIHPKTRFRRAINSTEAPIYLLNGESVVVYANPGTERWLDVEPGSLVGRQCTYDSASPATSATPDLSGLCPPPSVFEGPPLNGSIYADRGGRRQWRRAWFQALGSVDRGEPAVLVVASRETFDSPPDDSPSELRLHDWLTRLHQQSRPRYTLDSLVGTSPYAIQLKRQVQAAISSRADVVVCGPAGSGREHVARVIAEKRCPHAAPHVVHCAIADSEMIQQQIRQWILEPRHRAEWDVLLLIDIDRLSLLAQNELWGFSQLPDFQLHTIATSSQDLLSLAAEGQFHPGLAHYLSTLTIPLVSLADRTEDLPLLAQSILERYNREFLDSESTSSKSTRPKACQKTGFRPAALDCLLQYAWPGNLDQLDEAIRTAWKRATGPWIKREDLPEIIWLAQQADQVGSREISSIDLPAFLESIEAELIARALHESQNNRSLAAKRLNISRGRLLRRIDQLGLGGETSSGGKTGTAGTGKSRSQSPDAAADGPIFEPVDPDAGEDTEDDA